MSRFPCPLPLLLAGALSTCGFVSAQERCRPTPFDVCASTQFAQLNSEDQKHLAQAVANLTRLERALNSYMADHDGSPPETLDGLVPQYLDKLPHDPFANPTTTAPRHLQHFERSANGAGYLYQQKPRGLSIISYRPLKFMPTPGAWQIRSGKLPQFPLRNQVFDARLARSRGYWGRLILDVF